MIIKNRDMREASLSCREGHFRLGRAGKIHYVQKVVKIIEKYSYTHIIILNLIVLCQKNEDIKKLPISKA